MKHTCAQQQREKNPENNEWLVKWEKSNAKMGKGCETNGNSSTKKCNLLSRDKVKRSQFALLLSILIKHFPLYNMNVTKVCLPLLDAFLQFYSIICFAFLLHFSVDLFFFFHSLEWLSIHSRSSWMATTIRMRWDEWQSKANDDATRLVSSQNSFCVFTAL